MKINQQKFTNEQQFEEISKLIDNKTYDRVCIVSFT